METALGLLGWPPETFWRATPGELVAAYEGFLSAHGLKARAPLTREEFEALKRRFPDRERAS